MLKRIKELLARRGRKLDSESAASPAPTTVVADRPQGSPVVHRGPSIVHQPIPESELDADAVKIVQRLVRFDHAAYLVGGCVRDLLLDHRPKDFDIGTSATPRQIKRLFRNCRIIGRRFRLAHVYFQNGKIIEVATFRAQEGDEAPDASQEDLLIRDDNQFGTLEEDALRRDFTVNSLFYDVTNGNVLDHADGLADLRRRLIRTIGDPTIRFREDPIRILRAVRFAARLDFTIEPGTLEALRRTRHEIPRAATPRVLEEINRFCRAGGARRSFELLRDTGVFEVILPEIARPLADDARGWELLLGVLDGLDVRSTGGHDPLLGTILAALLLPVVASRTGWRSDAAPEARPEEEIRRAIEELLRPLALRLRVSRNDQEHCRLILDAILRIAAVDPRRGGRRALARHPALPAARVFLTAVGRAWGGAYAEAAAGWNGEVETQVAEGTAEGVVADDRAAGGRRRRRGRRGGRGRRGSAAPAPRAEAKPAEAAPARAAARDLPPVWDDNYFFAALPSVPELATDDGKPNRYGDGQFSARAAVAGPVDVDEPETESDGEAEVEGEAVGASGAGEASGTEGEPKRRRRRRRRRRGGGGGSSLAAPAGEGTPPQA
jgi:poly(A) polymerase